MKDETRHQLVWGWLRLFLGWTQMSLAAAGLGALLVLGNHPLTWLFAIGATLATIVSRMLYHGKPDPKIERKKRNESS